jgi:hypothetical protein
MYTADIHSQASVDGSLLFTFYFFSIIHPCKLDKRGQEKKKKKPLGFWVWMANVQRATHYTLNLYGNSNIQTESK